MEIMWAVLGIVLIAVWVLTLTDIIRHRRDRKHLAAWVIIVLLLPFLGAVLYWALREPTKQELQGSVDAQRELRERSPFDRTRTR